MAEPTPRTRCACPEHADAVDCIDLRYFGHAPGPNSAQPPHLREECQCGCHSEQTEMEDDDAE